jgi:hypothetical protein
MRTLVTTEVAPRSAPGVADVAIRLPAYGIKLGVLRSCRASFYVLRIVILGSGVNNLVKRTRSHFHNVRWM